MEYIVIADINKTSYMVRVNAESAAGAEHKVLDLGYCGLHEYTVEAAHAFDRKTMKTDFFINLAMASVTISITELVEIIEKRNRQIETRDKAEKRVWELEKQMKQLTEELENAKRILEETI